MGSLRRRLRAYSSALFCPVCERGVERFNPLSVHYLDEWNRHGHESGGYETCNVESYSCPVCGASDRDRLYALYLRERLPRHPKSPFVLIDFAPSEPLSSHIKRNYAVTYRSADLCMPGVDDHVDLTNMDIYQEASFDAFICSHVLEHVQDDTKAMAELYRILKPGGWGITMAPISSGASGHREDPSKRTESERWKFFGQGDHVRLYSKEVFVNRLETAGFTVSGLNIEHFGGDRVRRRCGLASTTVLYVSQKRAVAKSAKAYCDIYRH